MNILCINTGFPEAEIALSYNGKNFFKTTDSSAKHSENLLVEIEKIFNKAGEGKLNSNEVLKNIDVISVVVGPGSFTGLRIGISTVKALALTNEHMRIVSVGSLEYIAYLSKKVKKTPIIDGLSGYYFVSCYENEKPADQPKMITLEEVKNFDNLVSIEKLPFETEIVCFSPENLLSLTLNKIERNEFTKEENLLPLYIRPSQAEANLNGNKK